MYDKYWGQWRRQLIRKRVSELMQKHEEKKLLSEVRNAMVDNDNQNYMIWKTIRLGKKIKL